jgi:hypothetical protein
MDTPMHRLQHAVAPRVYITTTHTLMNFRSGDYGCVCLNLHPRNKTIKVNGTSKIQVLKLF